MFSVLHTRIYNLFNSNLECVNFQNIHRTREKASLCPTSSNNRLSAKQIKNCDPEVTLNLHRKRAPIFPRRRRICATHHRTAYISIGFCIFDELKKVCDPTDIPCLFSRGFRQPFLRCSHCTYISPS